MSEKTEGLLTVDTVLQALLSPRRRLILSQLKNADGRVSVDELVDQIVANEVGDVVEQNGRRYQTEVAVSLYHNHLPSLADAGLIEFDEDPKTVRYLSNPVLDKWVNFVVGSE